MSAVRHLSYSLLVPVINGYVCNVTSWLKAKQGGRGNNIHVSVTIQGLFTRHQDGFEPGKNITATQLRVGISCWIALSATQLDIFHVVH